MNTQLENYKLQELSFDESLNINGGGSAFKWLGEQIGYFNEIVKEAVKNGYAHAGLFY